MAGLVLVGVMCLLMAYYIYREQTGRYRHFAGQSIPGPRPWPMIGSMWSIFTKGVWETDRQWVKQYGRVIRTYEGSIPVLLVSSPVLIKSILVKEFRNFQNRLSIPLNQFPLRKSLTNLRGERWKYVRSTLTPSFSSMKLKHMTSIIGECADVLVNNLRQHATTNTPVELKQYCGAFTMDTIAATAFGLKINSQRNAEDQFVKNAKHFFSNTVTSAKLFFLFLFPSSMRFMRERRVGMFPAKAVHFFTDIISRSLQERKAADVSSCQVDFLQLMVEAERKDNFDDHSSIHNKHNISKTSNSENGHHIPIDGLSHEEILAQSLIFFLAGYETTATTLTMAAYCLATNPDCQQRALQEIDTISDKHDEITYEAVSEMEYLDMCVCETLRLFPPVARTNRLCSADTVIEGVNIKYGTCVSIPIFALHRDPEFWPDPDVFIPERFSREVKSSRDQYCWLPFGGGPRSCIGMRLAMLEIKIALMRILRHFRFAVSSETQVPLVLKKGSLLQPTKGVVLLIKHR